MSPPALRGQIPHRPLIHSLQRHAGVDAELGLLLGRRRLRPLGLAARLQEPEAETSWLVFYKRKTIKIEALKSSFIKFVAVKIGNT